MFETVLVTGGAGFAGSAVCHALKAAIPETRIVALDNLHRRGAELNVPKLIAAGVEFVHGDIRAPEDLATVDAHHPGLIIECSAEPSAQAGYGGSPEYLVRTNLIGCFNCLELARRCGASFLFLSTSRVYPYGPINRLPYQELDSRFALAISQPERGVSSDGISEEFSLYGARSLYGMTKFCAERMVEEYSAAYGIKYIINRFGLLTGPGQFARSDQGVIALWMAAHYFKRPLSYIGFGGTGKQVRDFLHVDDFCRLLIDQIRHYEEYAGRCYNAGGGSDRSLSLQETTRLCEEITGNKVPIGSVPETRNADVRIYLSDSRRVSAVRAWRPQCDATATLTSIFDWLRAEERALRPMFCTNE